MNPDLEAAQPNAVAAAVGWIEEIATGNLASIVAIIAVASLGLMLMTGRLPTRRVAKLIIGCFIVFGASSIAAGLMSVLGSPVASDQPAPIVLAPPPPPSPPQPTVASNYDPYAGAALPPRR